MHTHIHPKQRLKYCASIIPCTQLDSSKEGPRGKHRIEHNKKKKKRTRKEQEKNKKRTRKEQEKKEKEDLRSNEAEST